MIVQSAIDPPTTTRLDILDCFMRPSLYRADEKSKGATRLYHVWPDLGVCKDSGVGRDGNRSLLCIVLGKMGTGQ